MSTWYRKNYLFLTMTFFKINSKWYSIISFFVLNLLFSATNNAQIGNYYISNFTPSNYSATDQNRGIVQDKHQRIYSANLSGVLSYDGIYWKLIPLTNESAAISINTDPKGNLFVGGQTEIGFLKNQKDGSLKYQSLMGLISEKDKNFSMVWSTICSQEKVFFGSNENLIIYDYKKSSIITAPEDSLFHTFFKVNDFLFVRQFNVGFKVYFENRLQLIPNSKILANVKVRFILPNKNNEYWVGAEDGIYTLKLDVKNPTKSTFTKTPQAIDSWMKTNHINCGIQLSNGTYVLGSQSKGIVHLDNKLNILKSITYENGLQDEFISNIYEDYFGNIWLSLNKGITHIEINSPVTYWSKTDGIKGTIESSCVFDKTIFIGTIKGLVEYDKKTNKFKETPINTPVWDLCRANNQLLIATGEGVYTYNKQTYISALGCGCVYKLLTDKIDNSIVYIGGNDFFIIGKITGNKISVLKKFDLTGEVRSIFKKNNKVYIAINGSGIDIIDTKTFVKKSYTETDGLQSLQENTIYEYNNQIIISTPNGNYVFDENSKNKFTRDNKYNCFPPDYQISKATVVLEDVFFQGTYSGENMAKVDEISSLIFKNNRFKEDKKFLRRIKDVNAKHFHLSDSMVYISTNEGLFCYNLTFHAEPKPFKTIINSIFTKKDTIRFGVTEHSKENYQFNYSENELRFFLASTNYSDKNHLQFSYYLEGKDTTYSNWTKNNIIIINNLNEGHYILHAKSKDVLGYEGEEILFSFTILPPWYRTSLAYLSYFILLILLIWQIVKLYTKRLRDQNIKLESTITERTKTIVEQKVELEHKNKEILDSINYAQRIQKALLASNHLLNENLKDYFIFFKPKDIVSGDFYWGTKASNHHFILATADSTGHGVPGAIMSMLNISCLHEAIEGQKLIHTSDILNYTRSKIIKHLLNDGSEQGGKDGMDCSLIAFDFDNKKIIYSAANNPIWIVRTGELIELKPDKMPIGKHDKDHESFTQHQFDLVKNDMIYTLTDGMPDQFGGPKGKKFMYKQLKELLVSMSQLPMNEQKTILDAEFNNWKGNLEQVDDVLIIGIRI